MQETDIFPSFLKFEVHRFSLQGCYSITLDKNIFCDIDLTGSGRLIPEKISEQFKVNIWKKSFDILRESNNKQHAFWLYGKRTPKRENFPDNTVLCYIEDAEQEIVLHSQKPLALLQRIEKKTAGMSENYTLTFEDCVACSINPLIENSVSREINDILCYLQDKKFIQFSSENTRSFIANVQIKLTGWEYLASQTNKNNKRIFIAIDFDAKGERWKDYEGLTKNKIVEVIQKACKEEGFDANTIDADPKSQNIYNKIVAGIKESRAVIADFTFNNNGVYYESGYAEALNRDVLHIVHKEWLNKEDEKGNKINKLHFDIQQIFYRQYSNINPNDPDDGLPEIIKSWIKAVLK
jgi:hypothetical protein